MAQTRAFTCHTPAPIVAAQWPCYTAARESYGRFVLTELPMVLEMYVAADRQKAYIESLPSQGDIYAAYASWV